MTTPTAPPAPTTPKGCRHRHFQQTPRHRKKPAAKTGSLHGIKPVKETAQDIKKKVTERLKLTFVMDDWQAHMIHRIYQGYDSILLAGTGYGKSLVFQGLAAMDKQKIVVVICPLKALERDQVAEAEAKGLRATMVNENTVSPEVWASLRQGKDHLYYVSPEMALSDSFVSLWQDVSFRGRVQAVIVDEAHCIVDWGDDFRKEYSGLAKLRDYIGQEVPVVACTATCTTETFNVIWTSLCFGHRPFWGADVGCERQNLAFIICVLKNTKNPVLDALNILPDSIPKDAPSSIIPKCIFYFESVAACTTAMETIRKILPPSLRQIVQTFVALTSEAAKALLWDQFRTGTVCILCATDAAGMGCNVPDVEYVALFSPPRSLSVLAQRWGRAGRDRTIKSTCLLFLPEWAFRPKGLPKKTRKGKDKPLEPKISMSRRANLEKALEQFINLRSDEENRGEN
ncbi:P-loop containing nucleoside triphosphate hydrolase protein [Hygrophoropsis aurantiaca]|uniref:P-loop containing nucleoside triphosphate hydrolase protein n=1 Tax=Hygrophoropsis aurantiaca TaxID=72124 RepID=A0ACB7ZRC1_9AGAM|nr:P-loop containing nucleoside triphosphate hydrolase protein [Hygrophoropsis aurantiaca]